MIDVDAADFFTSGDLVVDPYPYYDALRARCPVAEEPHHGVVMVTGYEEAVAVYRDSELLSSCTAVTGPFPVFPVPLEGDDISDLIEAHRDELPYEVVARRPGDVASSYADPSRAHAELGWRATRSVDDMCADTWRWQSRNPRGYPEG